MKKHTVYFALGAGLAACASPQKPTAQIEPADPVLFLQRAREAAATEMMSNFRRVHFEFDSALITPESRDALALNAEIMGRFKEIHVEVQGHCDEVGSTEYNLALGQRRADSIRKYLVTAGVHAPRIATISYGEEAPVAMEGPAFSVNRRAEFRVTIGRSRPVRSSVREDLALAADRERPALAQGF